MAAKRAGMNLHHQSVVDAHARHFGQHLPAELSASSAVAVPASARVEEALAPAPPQIARRAVGWPWSVDVSRPSS